ncbi:hypothetical protein VTN00DRAFT_643 [Thermoascus crustaceus]|uniref:uncharacterized protein n=1 Tax=Thermoascus crustaceus TaxID=5088 RepID=UPI003744AE4C
MASWAARFLLRPTVFRPPSRALLSLRSRLFLWHPFLVAILLSSGRPSRFNGRAPAPSHHLAFFLSLWLRPLLFLSPSLASVSRVSAAASPPLLSAVFRSFTNRRPAPPPLISACELSLTPLFNWWGSRRPSRGGFAATKGAGIPFVAHASSVRVTSSPPPQTSWRELSETSK